MADKLSNLSKLKAKMGKAGAEGWDLMQKGRLKEAELAYNQAIEIAKELDDKPSLAVYLSYLALSKRGQNKLDETKADLISCLNIAETMRLTKIKAHAYLLLGEHEQSLNNFELALDHLLKALSSALSCEDNAIAEMAFGNLGLLYTQKGWAEQASACFKQALSINASSPNHLVWLGNLGHCLAELGKFDEAINYYKQAYQLAKDANDIMAQSICIGSEGNCQFEEKNYNEAIACYKQALDLSIATNNKHKAGIWLGNTSNAYRKLNQMDKAIEAVNKALSIAEELNDIHAKAAHLDSLGECYMQQGKIDQAKECYEKAIALSDTIEDRLGKRIYTANLARTHQQLGKLDSAFNLFKTAIGLFDEQRSQIKSDDLKTSFAARGQYLYRDMVNVCLSSGKRIEALEYVGQSKARAILDLLSNSPIDISELTKGDDQSLNQLIAKEVYLRDQITQLELLYWHRSSSSPNTRAGSGETKESMEQICNEWHETVDQLRRRHPNYASLVAVDALKFKDITSFWKNDPLLAKDTAVIEYYWTDQFLLATSIFDECTEPNIHVINDTNTLSSIQEDLNNFLTMSSTVGWEVPLSLCKRLFDRLAAEIINTLPNSIERLIIIPHSGLYRLPFGALHNGKEYLIEKYAISYLPTVSLVPILSQNKNGIKESPAKTKYLISAISDYSATRDAKTENESTGLEDLQHTLNEAQAIFDIVHQHAETKVIQNEEVKKSFTTLFGQYPIIHFAGHAQFNQNNPLASGLVLSDGSMLTASLILQNNVLKTNCGQLLVLSACQTGTNNVTSGGEIIGLTRALMYAGMPNLILSLWEVADLSTSDLMQNFHKELQAKKQSIAQALRNAQIKAIQVKLPLHAWSPFFHLGLD